jgi:hypothetical protein
MIRHTLSAIAIWAFLVPGIGLAQDYQDYPEGYGYAASAEPQVDVSVDMSTPGTAVTFETFHDGLAPYGEWISVGAYGRVWRPHVAAGWRPYYYGHWDWSDEGWLWVSDEPWGWGPYHYGRWAFDSYNGWLWVPGYQWAPAWVSWRFGGAAVGWAPLAPGFSIYVSSYPVVYSAWTFVPCARFVGAPIHRVAYAPSYVPSIFHGTMPAPPRATVGGARAPAWGGPARGFVEDRVGHPIAPVRTFAVASPAQVSGGVRNGAIPVYRPGGLRPPATGVGGPHQGWTPPPGTAGVGPGRGAAVPSLGHGSAPPGVGGGGGGGVPGGTVHTPPPGYGLPGGGHRGTVSNGGGHGQLPARPPRPIRQSDRSAR